jgi:hypothetical protein
MTEHRIGTQEGWTETEDGMKSLTDRLVGARVSRGSFARSSNSSVAINCRVCSRAVSLGSELEFRGSSRRVSGIRGPFRLDE